MVVIVVVVVVSKRGAIDVVRWRGYCDHFASMCVCVWTVDQFENMASNLYFMNFKNSYSRILKCQRL